jgi:hypothetical protein
MPTITTAARLVKLVAGLSLLAGCADDAASGAEHTGAEAEALYPLTSNVWHQSAIPVCWENGSAGTATQQGWVQSAVQGSWSSVAGVTFTGWGNCTPTSNGVRIRIDDSGPHTMGLGNMLDGMVGGMYLNFTFQSWSPACQSQLQFCIQAIAVHEFGHALGFAHEQNRPDTPPCADAPQGMNGDMTVGPWDLNSVMDYCSPSWNNNGQLSAGDKQGVQQFYGLLANPDAGVGTMSGWTITANGGNGWLANAGTPGAFVTSWDWDRRTQTIDLFTRGFDATIMASAPPIEISEEFSKTYCGDPYYLKVSLLDANMNVVQTYDTGTLQTGGACDYTTNWQKVSHVFTGYGPNVRYVKWEDGGKDSEFWAGNYGAQMRNAVLKVRPNRITNPSASNGDMSGWTITANGGNGWLASAGTPGAFVTSWDWDRRTQTIDLWGAGVSQAVTATAPPIYVSERFSKTYCGDSYYLKVSLLDTNMSVVATYDTGTLQTGGACDYTTNWQTVSYTFTGYGPSVRYVKWEDGGKDSELWAGNYGARMTDAVVAVLR